MELPAIAYISLASFLIPVAVGMGRIGRLTGPMRLFFMLISISAIVEIVGFTLGKLGIRNLWLIQFFHLFEIIVVLGIVRRWLRRDVLRGLTGWLLGSYLGFWVVAKFTFEPLSDADQYTYTTANLIALTFVVVAIFDIVGKGDIPLWNKPAFWIAGGFLLNYSSNFILFSVFRWLVGLEPQQFISIWIFHWVMNSVVNLLFTIALVRARVSWTQAG